MRVEFYMPIDLNKESQVAKIGSEKDVLIQLK